MLILTSNMVPDIFVKCNEIKTKRKFYKINQLKKIKKLRLDSLRRQIVKHVLKIIGVGNIFINISSMLSRNNYFAYVN
jgi:hypothetical protein